MVTTVEFGVFGCEKERRVAVMQDLVYVWVREHLQHKVTLYAASAVYSNS
jgi:hypothetical protein